jgi:hypothetical protein
MCVILCGLAILFADVAWGQSPRANEPTRQSEETIPEPPQQKEAWKPPACKVPDDFVKAAAMLFEQGLADPRGCEYRAVELTFGGPVHGWVLPAKEGDKQRYAVCWNGLVCPVASVGDKADLKKDIRTKDTPGDRGPVRMSWPGSDGCWDRRDLLTALLLRLGEGELASELWAANHPPSTAGDERAAQKEPDPYLALVEHWAWIQFERAREAHEHGDDAVALSGFRKLTAFAKVAGPEAKKRGYTPRKEGGEFCDHFMVAARDLLADQERRAREGKRETVVCVGPGRDPDQQKRIAALILRLDEIHARQWDFDEWSLTQFGEEAIVKALIREGQPAIEPLLKCYANDNRLTRTVDVSGKFDQQYKGDGVHQAAYVAIAAILDFYPISSRDDDRKEMTARFREHIDKTKGFTTPAERWFQVLADDKAEPKEWLRAAQELLSPQPDAAPETTVWSGPSRAPRSAEPRKPLGESLRRKKDPSVTDLLLKRIKQTDGATGGDWRTTGLLAADFTLVLAEWEPKAASEPLAAQSKRLKELDKWTGYVQLIEARVKLSDRAALDEYVTIIGAAHPKMLSENLFHLMSDHPDHPGMAKAAAELFADEKSPWVPLIHEDGQANARRLFELIPTRLLRQPAFRKAVLKELGDKRIVGKIHLTKDGGLNYSDPYGRGHISRSYTLPPKEEVKHDFRACDFVANKIGEEIKCAPRCELYWTEAERDKAVAACIDFLRRQQYELEWRSDSLRLDKPATAEQVEQGQAVFSLAGEEKVRVVSGLKLPIEADWITLKDHPYRSRWSRRSDEENPLRYEQRGKVVQAEEVFKDGKWRRFYGFVGVNHVARVPAEEIEFSPDEVWWLEYRDWVRVGPGLHAGLNVPPIKIEAFDDYPARLPADAALTFALVVRNSAGLEQLTPDAAKAVKVRLLYSPEIVSRQGALVPKATADPDWSELPLKPGAKFVAEKGKTLALTEEAKLAAFDLRDWFDVSKPGFYRLQLLPAAAEKDAAKEIVEVRFSLAALQSKPKTDLKP